MSWNLVFMIACFTLAVLAAVAGILLRVGRKERDKLALSNDELRKESAMKDTIADIMRQRYLDAEYERDRLADMVCGDVPKSPCYLSREIHRQAVAHGWWDDERTFPEIVALCHSELSEALEKYRDARPMEYVVIESMDAPDEIETDPMAFGERKPEGVAVEMVDCIIRILDWCCKAGVDVDDVIERKMAYNATRPYKHGGKVC